MPSTAPATADPNHEKTPRRFFSLDLLDNRYPALHGIRVLAIISVIQYHVTALWFERGLQLAPAFVDGALRVFFGMDLFFVLSGFLIGSILLRSLRDSGTQNLRRFYLRRIFRTFPSYWVVLTLLAVCFHLTAAQRHNLPWEYLYATNFLIRANDGPSVLVMSWGWSLALEEQFYLTVPLLFFVLHRLKSDRARIGLLIALWASALVVRMVIYWRHAPWADVVLMRAIYFKTHTRFDTLVAGILIAFVNQRYGDKIAGWLAAPFHRGLLGVWSASCLWLLLRPDMFGYQNVPLVHVFLWGTVTSLMYFGVVPLLLYGKGWIQKWLGSPVFRRTATLGYGVYLVHIPVIDHVIIPVAKRLQRHHLSALWAWPLAVTSTMMLSLAIAYVLHLFIEKPSLWFRERIAG